MDLVKTYVVFMFVSILIPLIDKNVVSLGGDGSTDQYAIVIVMTDSYL